MLKITCLWKWWWNHFRRTWIFLNSKKCKMIIEEVNNVFFFFFFLLLEWWPCHDLIFLFYRKSNHSQDQNSQRYNLRKFCRLFNTRSRNYKYLKYTVLVKNNDIVHLFLSTHQIKNWETLTIPGSLLQRFISILTMILLISFYTRKYRV